MVVRDVLNVVDTEAVVLPDVAAAAVVAVKDTRNLLDLVLHLPNLDNEKKTVFP